jgi:KaiC/GvpD/RAD55 family RecA-like ATPase
MPVDHAAATLEGLGLHPLEGVAECPVCGGKTLAVGRLTCAAGCTVSAIAGAIDGLSAIADTPGLRAMAEALANKVRTRAVPPRLTPGQRAGALGSKGPPIPTGIASLDRMTRGGFRAGGLVIIAGAPGAFKTALVVQLARKWVETGYSVSVLAADEAADGLLIRFGQGLGLARGALEDGDPEARADLSARLDALPGLSIFDADGAEEGATVENVAKWIADGAAGKPAILIVDSLQTVRAAGTDGANDPRARMGVVVTALKAAARLGLLVVTTCELARGAYRSKKTSDRTELLASLKESGAIEYGATVVIGLLSIRGENGVIAVETAKNRLGTEKPTFGLAMDFERATLTETATPEEVPRVGGTPEMNSEAQFAADMEATRQILRDHPGIRGNDKLCSMLKGVGKERARAAVRALRQAGEIANEGTPKHPLLHLQPASPPESPEPAGRAEAGNMGASPPESPHPFRGAGTPAGSAAGSAGPKATTVGEGNAARSASAPPRCLSRMTTAGAAMS